MTRWTHRPDGSTWGDWGEDDQLGRLNLLTPAKVREGIAEVREGLTFCLSLPLDAPGGNVVNPRRVAPVLSPTSDENGFRYNFRTGRLDARHLDVVCDDKVTLTLQYSSQWDSLCHVGAMFDADGDGAPEALFYNGFRSGADVVGPLAAVGADGHACYAYKLGVENMAEKPIQGRGVLVDLEKHFGRTQTYVGYDQLAAVMDADDVVVEPGDMLLLHTGYATELLAMGGTPHPERVHAMCAVLDGRDERLLQWISDSQIAALIADNYGVEAFPAKDGGPDPHAALPIHHHCLFKLGLNLGEMWYLEELALWLREHERSRFLLTAPPLRLPGAVGSPANPIATV
ncbi:cyclase family protein [Actinopolymorpha sp. B9G3]|uniref:cyclase family protein n=1 Tax=Actinopolymorpha sp. B9G3 TaxID=3158970 RepID=UPI0032D90A82